MKIFSVIFSLSSIAIALCATCDLDHPCPQGLECRSISYLPGTKACVFKTPPSGGGHTTKRNGRCPEPGLLRWPNSPSNACNSNQDCPTYKKCCPLSYGGLAYCTDPLMVKPEPTVDVLIVGGETKGSVIDFVGAVTLVQSNGYNVIVDTGSTRMTDVLMRNLWTMAGLTVEDIDMVVTTHGHPDHYGSLQSFSDSEQVFDVFVSNGKVFRFSPLYKKQRYLLNNDNNLEVIQTPGHTGQDITLIVRNVPGKGTVAVVGDLIMYKNDGFDEYAYDRKTSDESRRKVACMSDYIVPGHGPAFQMDAEQRSKFQC